MQEKVVTDEGRIYYKVLVNKSKTGKLFFDFRLSETSVMTFSMKADGNVCYLQFFNNTEYADLINQRKEKFDSYRNKEEAENAD